MMSSFLITNSTIRMIPKVIHYCWFGKSEITPLGRACIDTWNEYLPDYKLVKWDESNCPDNDFVKHHLLENNWAFVSDYVRLYALYNYGGIYLDTDVEVIKPLDDLLDNEGFLCYESKGKIANAVAGGAKGNIFYLHCMNYMMKRFMDNENYHISPVVTTNVFESGDYSLSVLDSNYFYPYNPYDSEKNIKEFMYRMITNKTYAIHHWAYSWEGDQGLNTGLCVLIGKICSKLGTFIKKHFKK